MQRPTVHAHNKHHPQLLFEHSFCICASLTKTSSKADNNGTSAQHASGTTSCLAMSCHRSSMSGYSIVVDNGSYAPDRATTGPDYARKLHKGDCCLQKSWLVIGQEPNQALHRAIALHPKAYHSTRASIGKTVEIDGAKWESGISQTGSDCREVSDIINNQQYLSQGSRSQYHQTLTIGSRCVSGR
jgi:hypothetical protein